VHHSNLSEFRPTMMWIQGLVIVCFLIDHATAFTSPSGLIQSVPMRTLRAPAISGITMQQTESNWNFGRFAKTFGFFNGNPLLKLIPFVPSGSPSVPQPAAVAAGNELILWNFEGMDQRTFNNMWAPLDDVVMGGVSIRYHCLWSALMMALRFRPTLILVQQRQAC